MVQGIFDDLNPQTLGQWAYPDTKQWDPDRNTREFIAAMPLWREYGLLGFTINLQGGCPFNYTKRSADNNPDPAVFEAVLNGSAQSGKPFLFIAASHEPHTPWNKGDPSQYPPASQGNSFPFAKWTCYDAGLQSGCIARWPGRVKPGAATTHKTHVFGLPKFAEHLAALRARLDSWMMRQGDAGQATEMKALERMPRNKGGEKQAKKTTQ